MPTKISSYLTELGFKQIAYLGDTLNYNKTTAGEFIVVKENNRLYRYEENSTQPVDNMNVLNTSDGGNTRWITVGGAATTQTRVSYTFEEKSNTIPLGMTILSKDNILYVNIGNTQILSSEYSLNDDRNAIILPQEFDAGVQAEIVIIIGDFTPEQTGLPDQTGHAGEFLTTDGTNPSWADIGGSGGTSNYNDLENKPSINGITLEGNKTTEDLGLTTSGSSGHIGQIGYTLRTTLPEGCAWCDGSEYTKTLYPDLYQMLLDNELSNTTYTTFEESVTNNGSCGFFALDTVNEKFKVPMLDNIYMKAGQTPEMFGAESLPNIKGTFGMINEALGRVTGAFKQNMTTQSNVIGFGTYTTSEGEMNFDASLSSSTYQDGAKVNPDHVTYKAFVNLYNNVVDDPSSVNKAETWAEGSDEDVTVLGGEHSAKTWAEIATNISALPLFAHIWSDHLLTNTSYLRADTFSWQDGNIYYTAYNELVTEKNLTTETSTDTINDITITYYRTPKGYKIVLPDMADTIAQLYENTGTAWYYILDTDNTRFKLPRNSRYESGTTTENAGDFSAESLPNITGNTGYNWGGTWGPSGVFAAAGGSDGKYGGTSGITSRVNFNASRVSSTYQDEAKVNPDHVTQFLYFYVGNTIQNETTIDVAAITEALNKKADRDLNNLTEDATNAVKLSDITNCITKISQDIKLELNNGTLTLKAGSKVYVPNGFESDNTTLKFDEIILDKDYNRTTTTTSTGYTLLYFNKNNQDDNYKLSLVTVTGDATKWSYSGNTAPTEFVSGIAYWYDTQNNIVKNTLNSGSTWEEGYSLPIAIVSYTQNTFTSLDQVFNGFGYIGSTVFALPSVEGLIPNGRNKNGSLDNILIKTSQLYTKDFSIQSSLSANLCIATTGIGFNPNLKYNENKNLLIDITTNKINNDRFEAGYLSVDEEGRPITFTIKNTFQAVDKNDIEWASTQSKPSDKYVDLTLQASGTTYMAPANGWFVFDKQAAAQGQYIQFNESNKCTLTAYAYNNDSRLSLLYPILKNKKISVVYNASGVTNYFRFIYDEGAK